MNSSELIDNVKKEDIIALLADLGSPCAGQGTTSEGGGYLMFRTICHNGDSPNKLWYYEDSKSFQCWTCCGSMSIYDLIMKVKNYSFKEAYFYLANFLGVSTIDKDRRIGIQDSQSVKSIKEEISNMERLIEYQSNKKGLQNISKFYNPRILKCFDDNAFFQGWIDEGITVESMKKFGICFSWIDGHILIPHYDIEGNLVGIRRRSLNPEDAKNKYMPAYINGEMYDHPLGLNLYGLFQNKKAIQKRKTAIIVEGEKSVMLSDSYYGDRSIAVATCGFNISDWQIQALKKLGVNTVYIGFDKDYDITKEKEYKQNEVLWTNYNHYITRLKTLGERIATYFTTYLLYDKKGLLQLKDSPMDRGKEKLEKLMQEAKMIKME